MSGPTDVRYVLDTNIWIYGFAGDAVVRRFLKAAVEADWVGYSVISKIEIVGYPGMTEESEHAAREVLQQYYEVQLDADVVERTIALRKHCRIKIPDAIIAASTMSRSATLVTRNVEDFKLVTGLTILDPFAEK